MDKKIKLETVITTENAKIKSKQIFQLNNISSSSQKSYTPFTFLQQTWIKWEEHVKSIYPTESLGKIRLEQIIENE
jgi:hypothetical protein